MDRQRPIVLPDDERTLVRQRCSAFCPTCIVEEFELEPVEVTDCDVAIEVELDLSPLLVVEEDGTSRSLVVELRPALWFV